MQFTKIQSLGNDFVVFGSPCTKKAPAPELIRKICDRHYGVGADCAVFIGESAKHDFFMHVYNPNGFEAEICGNALRCSAKYVTDNGYFGRKFFSVETLAGPRYLTIENGVITSEIGRGIVVSTGELQFSGISLPYHSVSVGNPHCVILTSALTNEEFHYLGEAIEKHPFFPNGTNVEFASINSRSEIAMRVWERGIGETLSCVTGSCACVAAAVSENLCDNRVDVHQAGGIVSVDIRECGNMFVSGNCTTVFKGTFIDK